MGKRKNPETSLEAYRALDPIKVSQTMIKISDALKVIGEGNFEDIAAAAGMPEPKVWKRLIDCVRGELIHATGETKPTVHGNKSNIFAPGPSPERVKRKERVLKGKTISDFSKALNQVKQSIHSQESLF